MCVCVCVSVWQCVQSLSLSSKVDDPLAEGPPLVADGGEGQLFCKNTILGGFFLGARGK